MIVMLTMQPTKHNRLQQKIGHENLQLHSCDERWDPLDQWENIYGKTSSDPNPSKNLPWSKTAGRCFLIDFEWRLLWHEVFFLWQWNFGNLYILAGLGVWRPFLDGPKNPEICIGWDAGILLKSPRWMKGTWGGFGFPCWTTVWWWNHMKLL